MRHERLVALYAPSERSRACRSRPAERGQTEFGQIDFLDEGVDHADRVARIDIILTTGRQKARLMRVGSLNN